MDRNGASQHIESAIDRIQSHAATAASAGVPGLGPYLAHYYVHVDSQDLTARRSEDLFGAAADHLQLAQSWQPGSTEVRVVNPRVSVDGWESDHSIILIVTDDLPFLVDSVIMEISRLELGIHLVVHPVMVDHRSADGTFGRADDRDGDAASFIQVEVDRQGNDQALADIETHLRRVLVDVRASVRDWRPMQQRMRDIAEALPTEHLPLPDNEVSETQQLLEWFADDHFTFLGYREYELTQVNGEEMLGAVAGSGLGILSSTETRPSKPVAQMPQGSRERIHDQRLLNLTKATTKATVHRASYMDYVGIKIFDEDHNVVGERRFLGLLSAEAYSRSVKRIPRVQRIVAEVVDRAAYPPGGHDEKRLMTILEKYPRDELFQMTSDDLFDAAMAIAGLQERRRLRLFARPEIFGRFITCLVYLPRDRYNTASREGIQALLEEAYGGTIAQWNTEISESVLARLYFLVRAGDTDPTTVNVDALQDKIAELIQDWDDDFHAELVHYFGEDVGVTLGRTYAHAFPNTYRNAFDPRTAVADAEEIEQAVPGAPPRIAVYREPGHPRREYKLKLYQRGDRVSLTKVMPTLTNLGVTVLDERPYRVTPDGQDPVWVYDFSLEHPDESLDFAEASDLLEEAFSTVWAGDLGDDGFNRLVLAAGLHPREVGVLRAYARYLQQAGIPQSQMYIEETLEEHANISRMLVDLFLASFDPERVDRDALVAAIRNAIEAALDQISRLDQDRIIRRFYNLIESTLRTSYFQVNEDGGHQPYLALKLDPTNITDLPEPRPKFEIYVFSSRFEGVHLRSGPVARGGLRWSDRNEDYRTEVLGLAKAQMVKNAVIVPAGAKGGFVLKRRPADRAELQAEVEACYKLFVGALLDLTDNQVEGRFVPPPNTVRRDLNDPYLVVAADKGTATFSDLANAISLERGFWLGDAFASGGSNGYDHKAMGITARGAWESVKRHFRELGRDVQNEPFSAVGIGDMAGDVFGNGMLQSDQMKLVAAFNHMHIFIDPDPDPSSTYAERQRLFAMPRSSWADYDQSLLSTGGGVYERSAKSISLSEEAKSVLKLESATVTPDELITAILRAPADLLWNGGIGTYVKASDESHADVGDKANDAIRVNGAQLNVKVVGEGGNLGMTQKGRVEFARNDGRLYTDAIDNAGGVDCSDHEVNIKILLDQIVLEGDLTAKQRTELLEEMTDEVAGLVLGHNYFQTQLLSTERTEAASMVDVHARYLTHLEVQGLLDRQLERLPDAEEMAERRLNGTGLSAPELAVVVAYTKNILQDDLLQSQVPDDEYFVPLLISYFPTALRERFAEQIKAHPLRREIIANMIANRVANRGGTSLIYRLSQETSAPPGEIAAAHMAAWEIFELDDLTHSVMALDNAMPSDEQMGVHLRGRQLAERATRLLLRSRPYPFSPGAAVLDLGADVRATTQNLDKYFMGLDKTSFDVRLTELEAAGVPAEMARRAAALGPSVAALDIVEVATNVEEDVEIVAAIYFDLAERLDLTWLRDRILALPRNTQWETLARLTLRGDLHADHRALTASVASSDLVDLDPDQKVEAWIRKNDGPVSYYRQTMADIRATAIGDLTNLLVASREVRSLISRTG